MISQTRHDALAFIRQNKSILLIVCIGFITRLVYTIFFSNYVAQHYFGHASFFENSSDFSAWVDALKNFIQTGTYTVNPDNELGYFGRMPGYALFIAPFYCLFGEHHFTYVISFAQLVLDTINIYMIYRIFKQLLPDSSFPYIAPFIYAINPINILWSSALFSEGLSVFFLVLCIYLYTCSFHLYNYFTVGLLSGFNILVRPQMALFGAAFMVLQSIEVFSTKSKKKIEGLGLFTFSLLLAYVPWPARNYLLHDKLVFTQNIHGFANWGIDVDSYTHYIVSVQSNWQPQFDQIIHNKPFLIDKKIAYVTPTDSADLARAIFLSQHYGSSFSNWAGYWKEKVKKNKSDTTIAELFSKLQKNQMKHNTFHYWITLPLNNLQKCFFKSALTQPDASTYFKVAPLVFAFRTTIILLGLIGSVLLFSNSNFIFKLILLFFVSWYLLICFGPSAQMRNVEMRYLLQVDTLMIIPASYCLSLIIKKTIHISSIFLRHTK